MAKAQRIRPAADVRFVLLLRRACVPPFSPHRVHVAPALTLIASLPWIQPLAEMALVGAAQIPLARVLVVTLFARNGLVHGNASRVFHPHANTAGLGRGPSMAADASPFSSPILAADV